MKEQQLQEQAEGQETLRAALASRQVREDMSTKLQWHRNRLSKEMVLRAGWHLDQARFGF